MQQATFIFYDEVPQLTISALSRQNILTPCEHKQATVKWHLRDAIAAAAHISCNTLQQDGQFIEISYEHDGKLVESKVALTTLPSNLGKGHLYYFICPQTKVRCSTLYLINGLFLHRSASRGTYRIKNIYRKTRERHKWVKSIHARINAGNELNQPYFKATYAGAPTKRYKKILRALQAEI